MSRQDQQVFLDKYLRERGPIPFSKAGRIAIEVLKEVDARAQRGGSPVTVIHPGRICIVGGNVTLIDTPELATDAHFDDSLAAYTSPEELQGRRLDVRSTLYSLGCTLFELLTGQKPFPYEDADEIRIAHVQAPVPDPRGLNRGVPTSMSQLIRSLLAKDPAERPASALAALAEIQACLGMTPRPQARAPQARPRSAAGGAAGASRPRASPPRAAPARRAPGRQRASAPRARHRDELGDEEYYDERTLSRYRIAKPQPVFTYAGLVLGVVFATLVLIKAMNVKKQRPQHLAEQRAAQIEAQRTKTVTSRKTAREVHDELEREAASALQAKLSWQVPAVTRRDSLGDLLNTYHHTPSGRRMAEEYLKLHAQTMGDNRGLRVRSAGGDDAKDDDAKEAETDSAEADGGGGL